MTMRGIVYVPASPMCCHVFPASTDLKTPAPACELRKILASPVPIQTMSGLEGARVTSPMAVDGP
jgi:hypothetical protein